MYLIKTNFHDLNFYICISISVKVYATVYILVLIQPELTTQMRYLAD